MDQKALERVLSCPTLPSLPGVAIRMLELLRQPDCTADKIAQVIQNDPALASKVLRTVNSSYYGLTQPCPTITRAVALLGINTIKSLTLGLSLIDMTKSIGQGFDLDAYWKRAVYGAAGARLIAKLTRSCDPDEVFVASLLQDVGMLACYAALGAEYGSTVSKALEHDALPAHEESDLGFDHAEAGARMAEKWRLPEQIVACTRSHHQPDSALPTHAAIVRVVAASGIAAAALISSHAQPRVVAYRKQMRAWFEVDGQSADTLLRQIGASAHDLGKLFELNTGAIPDITSILSQASEQLLEHQVEMERAQSELARQTITDALTGVRNRKHFDSTISRVFSEAAATRSPLSVLFVDADKFKSVNDTHGHQAGDAVLVAVAGRLRDLIAGNGEVCRYGGEEFAIILPGCDADRALSIAEAARAAIESTPIDISSLQLSTATLRQTVSVGVSSLLTGGYSNWESLVHAADEAVYAAKQAGRNRVCAAAIAAKRATPEPLPPRRAEPTDARPVLLVVEDDALSAKMLEVLFAKHGQLRVVIATSAEDALKLLTDGRRGAPLCPPLVLADFNLAAMSGLDLTRAIKALPALRHINIAVMSAQLQEADRKHAIAAGAVVCFKKSELCADLAGSLKRISGLMKLAA